MSVSEKVSKKQVKEFALFLLHDDVEVEEWSETDEFEFNGTVYRRKYSKWRIKDAALQPGTT